MVKICKRLERGRREDGVTVRGSNKIIVMIMKIKTKMGILWRRMTIK